MTRRNVIFRNIDRSLWISDEFNGDKTEFEQRGSCLDSCDTDWEEILQCFSGVTTLPAFREANEKAQRHYHSFLPGQEISPIERIASINSIGNDELYLLTADGTPLQVDGRYWEQRCFQVQNRPMGSGQYSVMVFLDGSQEKHAFEHKQLTGLPFAEAEKQAREWESQWHNFVSEHVMLPPGTEEMWMEVSHTDPFI